MLYVQLQKVVDAIYDRAAISTQQRYATITERTSDNHNKTRLINKITSKQLILKTI